MGCDFLFDDSIIILSIINPMITGKVLIVSEMNNIKNEIEVNNVECDFYCIDNNKFGYEKKYFFYDLNSANFVFSIVLNLLNKPSKSKKLGNEKVKLIKNEFLVNFLEFDPNNNLFKLIMKKNSIIYLFSLTHILYYGFSSVQESDIRDKYAILWFIYFCPKKL